MAENSISKITCGNSTYSIADKDARNNIANLEDTLNKECGNLDLKYTNLLTQVNLIETNLNSKVDEQIKHRTIVKDNDIDTSYKIVGRTWLVSKEFKFGDN